MLSTAMLWSQTTPPNPNPPPPGLPIDGWIGAGIFFALLLGAFYKYRSTALEVQGNSAHSTNNAITGSKPIHRSIYTLKEKQHNNTTQKNS